MSLRKSLYDLLNVLPIDICIIVPYGYRLAHFFLVSFQISSDTNWKFFLSARPVATESKHFYGEILYKVMCPK